MQKLPYMLIVGDNEVANGTVSVRGRDDKTVDMTVSDFIAKAADDIATRRKDV